MAKTDQFPLDAAMPAARVLPGQPENKVTYLVTDRRTSGPVRVCPMPADQPAVPGQQRGRGDDPMPPQLARKGLNERGQHGPVWPGQARTPDWAAQHGDLVAQYQQLGGHRRIAAGRLRQPAEHSDGGQVQQTYNHGPDHA
jgi:hypothetical protein